MRKPDSKETRRQFADLFVVSAFCVAGLVVAFLLMRRGDFAQVLGTDKSSDSHVAVSLIIGVGLSAVLTVAWLWIWTRRRKRGGHVA
jgi:hypothetical protein